VSHVWVKVNLALYRYQSFTVFYIFDIRKAMSFTIRVFVAAPVLQVAYLAGRTRSWSR